MATQTPRPFTGTRATARACIHTQVGRRHNVVERKSFLRFTADNVTSCRPVCRAAADVDAKGNDAWNKALEMFQNGEVYEGIVRSTNRGGVLVDCWGTAGFIPNSMVSPTGRPEEGQLVRALFVEVDELQNRMILSQRQVLEAEMLRKLEPGQQVQGKVSWIENYGAFVEVALSDGRTVNGLVHKSELSWGVVITPESVVTAGEWVKCVVMSVDPAHGRLSLSLKRMKPDPLKQNLETSLLDTEGQEWRAASSPLPGLEAVISELRSEEGISDVKVGRQATVKGVVSQDLELWLTKDQIDDHFNVVARAGSTLQELAVYCTLSKDEVKAAIDKVLTRVS